MSDLEEKRGLKDKCNSGLVGNFKERNHLEGLDLDWRMILKWILKK